jgi:hypothetical protein
LEGKKKALFDGFIVWEEGGIVRGGVGTCTYRYEAKDIFKKKVKSLSK